MDKQSLALGSAVAGVQRGVSVATIAAPEDRQLRKEGEVNISVYFPAEVKASLRVVQAKTGNNVKEFLAKTLGDLFRKYNLAVSVDLGEGR